MGFAKFQPSDNLWYLCQHRLKRKLKKALVSMANKFFNFCAYSYLKALEKLPPYGRLFSSSCEELQPSAAISGALRAHFFRDF